MAELYPEDTLYPSESLYPGEKVEEGEEELGTNLWTPDVPTTLGKVPTKHETLSAADVQTWVNNGKQVLRITAGSTECKAKVKPQQKPDGITTPPREVVVKEATKLLGPFPKSIYNNEEEKVELELSATTGVVVELFEL